MRAIAVIPARYQSSRLPGKLLLDRSGKTVLEHVFDGCQGAREIAETWIATDDERIAEAAKAFGARAVMTSPDHPSGTDRVAAPGRRRFAEVSGHPATRHERRPRVHHW